SRASQVVGTSQYGQGISAPRPVAARAEVRRSGSSFPDDESLCTRSERKVQISSGHGRGGLVWTTSRPLRYCPYSGAPESTMTHPVSPEGISAGVDSISDGRPPGEQSDRRLET